MLESKVSQKLTFHAKKCLKEAQNLAIFENSSEIRSEHLFYAICLEKGCLGNTILKNIGIGENILPKSNYFLKKRPILNKNKKLNMSSELKSIIIKAYQMASNFNYPYVGTEHFVYALLDSNNKKIQEVVKKFEPNFEKNIEKVLNSAISNDSFSNLSKIFDLPEINISKNKKSSNKLSTPYLDQFCTDLNKYVVEKNETIIGREKELGRIINILGRKGKNNPVLIGDPGTGKTALVSKLAQKINSGEVPPALANKKILSLDMALVVAGTSFRGEFESRIKEIIKEAKENKNIILFIDEIHNVVGAGNLSGGLDAANILKPSLSKGEIQCIGATTISEFKKYFEKDPALERRFQPLKINEPDPEETKTILKGIKENYENFHKVTISEEAIEKAVILSTRYINNRFLPDKAIDLIDETASAIKNKGKSFDLIKKIRSLENEREKVSEQKNNLVNQEKYDEALALRQKEKSLSQRIDLLKKKDINNKEERTIIKGLDIVETVSQITGIPVEKLSVSKSSLKIKNLEKDLKSKIIGQKEALKKITEILIRSSSGIANPERPLGSFLFLGPTGVGKTMTAKILAQDFFGSPQNLVRIDMSEFMEKHNISRLIGAPAGYVGFEEGGKLTEKIRHQPYSVVLFDEIEKAHPDVFNILLQILEDGILTDAEGKEINFKNTVIIMTSNLGTSEFVSSAQIGFKSKETKAGLSFDEIRKKVIEELKKQMKPEIINRLDHIIVFNPLQEKEIRIISRLELEKLRKRLEIQGINFLYFPKIVDFIAKKSLAFDQGARLIRRNIQEFVENQIARMIVAGKIKNKKITLNIEGEKIKAK